MPRVSDNDNLELKKRSRRRLVGAAALALIAAIVLPMVMDSEPATSVRDIQVSIPESTLDSSPITALPEPVRPQPLDVPSGSDAAAPEVEQALRPIEPQDASPETARRDPPASSAPARTEAPAAPVPDKPPAAPRATVPAPQAGEDRASADGERAKAILEGRASEPASPNEFVVQVGAFSDAGAAESRQLELAARGFKSYIEQAAGVSRVRIGPFASRADAEAMVSRLARASIDGVVARR